MLMYDKIGWEKYDKETWGYEWGAIDRLELIKETKPGQFTLIVGTVTDAEYVTSRESLADAKAVALRYMILIKNGADVERLKWII